MKHSNLYRYNYTLWFVGNDNFDSGRKSTDSSSPKSSDDSSNRTPDLNGGSGSDSIRNSHQQHNHHHHHHKQISNSQSNLNGIGNNTTTDSPQIIVSSAPSGFPTHLSSLASYYSQLNQVPGTTLAPSLAQMAQYGQLAAAGQNPYGTVTANNNSSSSSSASDFRRALPVIF